MSSTTNNLSSGLESLSDPRADRFVSGVNDENGHSPIDPTLSTSALIRTHISNVKPGTRDVRSPSMKWHSIVEWYRILRVHYQWPLYEAIRYALWLSR